jgi:hypothetical protein
MDVYFFCSFLLLLSVPADGWKVELSPSGSNIAHKPVGTPLAVLCVVSDLAEDSQRPVLIWRKTQENIFTKNNVEVKQEVPFTISLYIHNGTVENNGVYECVASIADEVQTARVDVNFFEDLHFVDKAVDVNPSTEGVSFNLSCRVFASPTSDLMAMWEKGLLALTNSSERSYRFHDNNQILEIHNYRSSTDDGVYECKIFDRKSGSIISRQIRVGGLEEKQRFCTNLCTNICGNLYNTGKTNSL